MSTTSIPKIPSVHFNGNLLILGSGSVSQCLQPLVLRHLDMDPSKITILDALDLKDKAQAAVTAGATFVQKKLTPENLGPVLETIVDPGDLMVNLTWNIDTEDIITWCRDNEVRYIDTSVEQWDPYADMHARHPVDKTLYARHHKLRRLTEGWTSGPTAIVEHGANPGLVSHWVRRALDDIAEYLLDTSQDKALTEQIQSAKTNRSYAELAMSAGVRIIHVSERDTQITSQPKEVGEFVNTWSVEGFYEEGIAPAELGWGTHERKIPNDGVLPEYGTQRQICLARPGMETWVKSWVPTSGPIEGLLIRHGEALSITDSLTVRENDNDIYRPTVHYAYLPSDVALASLRETKMQSYTLQEQQRILGNDIISGMDELGVLLLGTEFGGWWTGSQLSIEETRDLVENQNATTLQVAASVLGAIYYAIRHPNEGFCLPDDLDHREILEIADPYLEPCPSVHSDWSIADEPIEPLKQWHGLARDPDIYQFENYRVA